METKYCKRCDATKSIDSFHVDRSRKDGRSFYCRDCKEPRLYTDNIEGRRARQRENYLAARELLIQLKSRPCADCGNSYPFYVMEYDHRDPASKKLTVSQWCSAGSIKGMLEEIEKCDLVCGNCHRERTHRQREEGVIPRGRPRKYA